MAPEISPQDLEKILDKAAIVATEKTSGELNDEEREIILPAVRNRINKRIDRLLEDENRHNKSSS